MSEIRNSDLDIKTICDGYTTISIGCNVVALAIFSSRNGDYYKAMCNEGINIEVNEFRGSDDLKTWVVGIINKQINSDHVYHAKIKTYLS